MTIKDNQFALEVFVANHNMEHDDDQLEIIDKTEVSAILTNGKIKQFVDFTIPLQRQTLWFIANRKIYRQLDKTYQRNMMITVNGFSVFANNSRIFFKPIGTKDIYVTIERYNTPKQLILKSNGVKTIIKNPDEKETLDVIKRCSQKATYDNLNKTIQQLQYKIQSN